MYMLMDAGQSWRSDGLNHGLQGGGTFPKNNFPVADDVCQNRPQTETSPPPVPNNTTNRQYTVQSL